MLFRRGDGDETGKMKAPEKGEKALFMSFWSYSRLEMRDLRRPDVSLFRKDGGSGDSRMTIPCRNFVGQEYIRHSRSSKNDCRVRLKRVACQKSLFNPALSV
ncbi:MAG TPA: hypothetical protein DDX86_03035 [Akkermansia sp.]|nr:hypothetical protein [Akkermansia sp.]